MSKAAFRMQERIIIFNLNGNSERFNLKMKALRKHLATVRIYVEYKHGEQILCL